MSRSRRRRRGAGGVAMMRGPQPMDQQLDRGESILLRRFGSRSARPCHGVRCWQGGCGLIGLLGRGRDRGRQERGGGRRRGGDGRCRGRRRRCHRRLGCRRRERGRGGDIRGSRWRDRGQGRQSEPHRIFFGGHRRRCRTLGRNSGKRRLHGAGCTGAGCTGAGCTGAGVAGAVPGGALWLVGATPPPKDQDAREPASSSSVIPTTPAPGRTNRHIAVTPRHTRAC